METCNAITSSLFYLIDDEGEKLDIKALDKDLDLSTLPDLGKLTWHMDDDLIL